MHALHPCYWYLLCSVSMQARSVLVEDYVAPANLLGAAHEESQPM